MTIKPLHLKWSALGLGMLVAGACTVTGVGMGYEDGGPEYVGGFYEPYGYDYGGWGRGYRVGPPRGGERGPGPDHGGGRDHGPGPGAGHPYRAAPAGRPMPSMPGRSRGH
jgi:hypothetical protein